MALSAGANSIGLLVGLTHRAEDKIDEATAIAICNEAHNRFSDARVVLVTHLIDPVAVEGLAVLIGVDSIQVHDDMCPDDVRRLREALPDVELFKAVHIEANVHDAIESVIQYATRYEAYVDGFLTDSKSIDPDGQLRIGGTGKRHDPAVGAALVKAFPGKPVILAGGLNGENAAQAILDIGPAGIDANSGLENPDGSKNEGKIRQFATAGMRCPLHNSVAAAKSPQRLVG